MESLSSKASRVILVFSKAAEHGSVKTRLRPAIDDDECLRLHLAMLRDTLECCSASAANVLLYLTGNSNLPFAVPPVRFQVDGDLGKRMHDAFLENLALYQKVLIVGIDTPALTPAILEEAFTALDQCDLVLGPSEDGGYYLIGLRTMIPGIFENIPWSTPDVLRRTLERIPGSAVHLLPRLWDVDQPADLLRLEQQIGFMPQARHQRGWIASRRAR